MMTKIVVETCSIDILLNIVNYTLKCVDSCNINNLIFYAQQDADYKVYEKVNPDGDANRVTPKCVSET
jgi:hypothetical protein